MSDPPTAVPTARGGTESLSAASLDVAATGNSQLRQVLQRYQRVFTEVLPVKAEQIAAARHSIVRSATACGRSRRERRMSPAIEAATVGEGRGGRGPHGAQQASRAAGHRPERSETGEVTGWRICGDYRSRTARAVFKQELNTQFASAG